MSPRVLILRSAGTNCDVELSHAFARAGADPTPMHLNTLVADPAALHGFDLLGIPGGFSYGDDIAAGRILANRVRHRLMDDLRRFVADGKPVIGICNGFQVLIKTGLLPGLADQPGQVATLADNARPRFVDRWVKLRVDPASRCIWTRGLDELALCIAHGEGRFVAPEPILDALEAHGQVPLRYTDNPNGSMRDIAGVCDPTGMVLGLMPHPERNQHPTNDPQWTRAAKLDDTPPGLRMFINAVEYAADPNATANSSA
jgi:phosphoribosylformylglycinamidine synthase